MMRACAGLGAALLISAVLVGCSDGGTNESAVNGAESNRSSGGTVSTPAGNSGAPALEIRDLRDQVHRAYDALREHFVDPLATGEAADNPFLKIPAEFEEQLSRCEDDSCRRDVLLDQLNRLRFPFGRATTPVRGIPWRNGSFGHHSAVVGSLRLLPYGGDRIIVRIDTAAAPDARWMCNLVASGRILPGGVAVMKTIDEGREFELVAEGPRRVIARPHDEDRGEEAQPGCTQLGYIFLPYELD